MLTSEQVKQLETLTVELILAVRRAYTRDAGGKVALNYWTMLENRLLYAAQCTKTASHLVTKFVEGMAIQSTGSLDSDSLIELINFCDSNSADRELRTLIKQEHPFLIVLARKTVQERKEEQQDSGLKFTADELMAAAEAHGLMDESEAQS